MRYYIIATCWILVSAGSLSAQRAPDPRLPVGARVRVQSVEGQPAGAPRAEKISGRIVAQRADSLYVESQPGMAPRPVALANVRRLWVSQGQLRRRTLPGTALGALAGGALLAAITAAVDNGCDNRPPTYDCMTLAADPLAGFGVGALVGGVVGGTIGFFRRSERWHRVR
jgi:hypothetical protein